MKIAITGGTGFVGRTLARRLLDDGHEVVLLARGVDQRDPAVRNLPRATFHAIGLADRQALARAFDGCEAVAHCAGINRETGGQTYGRVHVEGTAQVVAAAQAAGVRKIALLSFLRARPHAGCGYHESKWKAEEIIRTCGLDYTIFKAGVIYGRGDHMLDHLSQAFYTFPIFALVGFRDQRVRPLAVEDMAGLLKAALVEGKLARKVVAVTGPEEMTLREAVARVADATGRKPRMFPAPLWFHYLLAWGLERVMRTPLVSLAQVRILSEGVTAPAGPVDPLPAELLPRTPFSGDQIRRGLPPAGGFGLSDLRCGPRAAGSKPHRVRVFLETP